MRTLKLSKSSYYYRRKLGKRGKKASSVTLTIEGNSVYNESVVERIKAILKEPYCDYGHFKVCKELQRQGFKINHKKVYRLMKANKLLHNRIERDRSGKEYVKYRKVNAKEPYEHLQIDIKYIYVSGIHRNVFLASIIDVYSRSILVHKFAYSIRKHDVIKMMDKILTEHPGTREATLRSDNGSQFEANLFRDFLSNKGIKQEFTHFATPQENAYIESYHSIINRELCSKFVFDSFDEAKREIASYLKYYNEKRLHSGIGYRIPMEVLQSFKKEEIACIDNELNISLPMSDEAETGSAGAQLVRNNPTDWNGRGVGEEPTSFNQIIPVINALENSEYL